MVDFSKVKVITLNPEQRAVSTHVHGPLLVPAVAGAGKTAALVARVKSLIYEARIPASRILLVAFNADATAELNRRMKSFLQSADKDVARTTHKLALSIFQREIDPDKKWRIDSTGALYTNAIRLTARQLGVSEPPISATKALATRVKNDLIPFNEVMARLGATGPGIDEELRALADEILGEVRERGSTTTATASMLIDLFFGAEVARNEGVVMPDGVKVQFVGFDDMLFTAATLLRKDEVRERWSGFFDHVIVDEAQDLNLAQQSIITALASRTGNLCLVGDVSQCIYEWRGANPDFMPAIRDANPHLKVILMDRNYRSGKLITDCANAILRMMDDRTRMGLEIKPQRKDLGFVNYRLCQDVEAEASDVAWNVQVHHQNGVPWNDMAIIVRTLAQTEAIEMALLDAKVPVRLVSGKSFFALRETKILISYLRVIFNRADEEDFALCVMNPSRFLGKAFVAKAVEKIGEANGDWLDAVALLVNSLDPRQRNAVQPWLKGMREIRSNYTRQNSTPLTVLHAVLEWTDLKAWLVNDSDAEDDSSISDNIDRVKTFTSDFTSANDMCERLKALSDQRAATNRDAVTISTVHKMKGLEYKVVFIIGMANGCFPLKDKSPEETRIAYVAVTRAMDELWISRPRVNHRGSETQDSSFVKAMGLVPDDKPIGPQVIAAGQMKLLGGGG